jgi:hypothetical protein
MSSSWLSKKLTIFMGKGGVGKTSVSTAFALAASRLGKRVLLVEVKSPKRVPTVFKISADSDGPFEISKNLDWMNLTPATALETYAMQVLRFKAVYKAVFEQRMVRRFLRAVPALAEILMLGHLVHILEKGEYDLAVMDAPSSGPGAMMLEAPQAVMQSSPQGALYDGAAWIDRLIGNPERTMIHLIVLPEELPVSEAIGLHYQLKEDLDLSIGAVFANRTFEDPFKLAMEPVLRQADQSKQGKILARAANKFNARLRLQERYLDRLGAGVGMPIFNLPEIIDHGEDLSVVNGLAEILSDKLQEQS